MKGKVKDKRDQGESDGKVECLQRPRDHRLFTLRSEEDLGEAHIYIQK